MPDHARRIATFVQDTENDDVVTDDRVEGNVLPDCQPPAAGKQVVTGPAKQEKRGEFGESPSDGCLVGVSLGLAPPLKAMLKEVPQIVPSFGRQADPTA